MAAILVSEKPGDRSSDLVEAGPCAELAAAIVRFQGNLRNGPVDQPGHRGIAAERKVRVESGRHVGLRVDVLAAHEGREVLALARSEQAEEVVTDFEIGAARLRGDGKGGLLFLG